LWTFRMAKVASICIDGVCLDFVYAPCPNGVKTPSPRLASFCSFTMLLPLSLGFHFSTLEFQCSHYSMQFFTFCFGCSLWRNRECCAPAQPSCSFLSCTFDNLPVIFKSEDLYRWCPYGVWWVFYT
jgi:hypothetical protein